MSEFQFSQQPTPFTVWSPVW